MIGVLGKRKMGWMDGEMIGVRKTNDGMDGWMNGWLVL
jgi:hypothetical protein